MNEYIPAQGTRLISVPSPAMRFHSQDIARAISKADSALENLADAHYECGRASERERIIKLLEAKGDLNNPEWKLTEVIALIKGEEQ